MRQLFKAENMMAIAIAVSVVLLANLPLLYAILVPKTGLVFLGRRVINSQDTYTYLSFIEQSRQGKTFLANLYTTESQTATQLRPSYVLIGKFAAVTHLSSLVTFHLFRILFSFLFCWLLYLWLGVFIVNKKNRLLAFGLCLTASGLGWLLGRFVTQSSDLWIPELNTFLTLTESPHFILSQVLVLTGALAFFHFIETRELRFVYLTCLAFFILTFEHPFDAVVLGPTLLLAGIFSDLTLKESVLISGMSTLGLLYPFLEWRLNPLFAAEQLQGASPSPTPLSYAVGLGLLLPFAGIGLEKLWPEKRRPAVRFLLFWVVIAALSLYAPVSFQRRLSETLLLPVATLAAIGVIEGLALVRRVSKPLSKLLLPLLLLVLSMTSLFAIVNDILTMSQDNQGSYYYYVAQSDLTGIQWLGSHATSSDVILTNWFYGNLVPGMIGRKVYLGHKAQTIGFDDKVKKVNAFLLEPSDFVAIQFLKTAGIRYIFLGVGDTILQYGFQPERKSYLQKVFQQGGTSIYKVIAAP